MISSNLAVIIKSLLEDRGDNPRYLCSFKNFFIKTFLFFKKEKN